MPAKADSVDKALRNIQRLMRRRYQEGNVIATTRQLPQDLSDGIRNKHIRLRVDELEAISLAEELVRGDLRFEHLRDKVKEEVWRFTAQSALDDKTDFVPTFIDKHAKEPFTTTCYVPIENLKVAQPLDFGEMRLLPIDNEALPERFSSLAPATSTGSYAAVETTGTDPVSMAGRARGVAKTSLRLLRLALRSEGRVPVVQLRFRVGMSWQLGQQVAGASRPPGGPIDLDLTPELLDFAKTQLINDLPQLPADIKKRVHTALRWLERSLFEADPLVALLFQFFALEAMLGDKSERTKAHGLAFRRAMLGHAVSGGFSHPNETYYLYDEVRSVAVHGGEEPSFPPKVAKAFAQDVNTALGEYLRFVQDNALKRRSQVLKALKEHPDHPELETWLREHAGPDWQEFLQSEER